MSFSSQNFGNRPLSLVRAELDTNKTSSELFQKKEAIERTESLEL